MNNSNQAPLNESQTEAFYKQNNEALLAQQQQEQLIAAAAQRNQPATTQQYMPSMPGGQQAQKNQLPSPLYDMENAYASMQAVNKAQLSNLQGNIVRQQQLRSLTSEGYQGVTAAIDLYRKAHRKGKTDITPEILQGINPIMTSRREELMSAVGAARSRVNERYRGSLENISGRYTKSAEVAAINLGRDALIDYTAGLILNNSTNVNPFMDASVLESTAKAQAIAIIDAYTTLLPKKRIETDKDLVTLLNFVQGYNPDDFDDDIFLFADNMSKIGLESAYVNLYTDDLQKQAVQSEQETMQNLKENNVDQTEVVIGDLPMASHQKIGIAHAHSFFRSAYEMARVVPTAILENKFTRGLGDIGIGAAKAVLKSGKDVVQVAASIPALAADTIAFSEGYEADEYMKKVQAVGAYFDEILSVDENAPLENLGNNVGHLLLMFGLGSAVLPSASIIGALGAGATATVAGYIGLELINGLSHVVQKFLYSDDTVDHPSRPLVNNFFNVFGNVAILFALHKLAKNYTLPKSTSLYEVVKEFPESMKAIETMTPQNQILFENVAKKINLEEAIQYFTNVDTIDGLLGSEMKAGVAQSALDLMAQDVVLSETSTLRRLGTEAAIKETQNSLMGALKARDSTFKGTTSSSLGRTIFDKVKAIKDTITLEYKAALGEKQYVPASEIFTEDIINQVTQSGLSPEVLQGIARGIAKYRHELWQQNKVKPDPAISHQISLLDELSRTVLAKDKSGAKPYNMNVIVSNMSSLPHTLLQDILVEVAQMYTEDGSNRVLNTDVLNTKTSFKNQLVTFLTEDQLEKYEKANNAHGLVKKAMLLFERYNPDKTGFPIDESTQVLNKFEESSNIIRIVRDLAEQKGLSENVVKQFDELEDLTLFYPVLKSVGKKQPMSPQIIETMKTKIQSSAFRDDAKAEVLNILDILSYYAKEFQASKTPISKKTQQTQPIITNSTAGGIITGLANMVGSTVGKVVDAVIGTIEQGSGIKKSEVRDISLVVDLLYKNPALREALQFMKDNYAYAFDKLGKAATGYIVKPSKSDEED